MDRSWGRGLGGQGGQGAFVCLWTVEGEPKMRERRHTEHWMKATETGYHADGAGSHRCIGTRTTLRGYLHDLRDCGTVQVQVLPPPLE